YQPAYGNLSRAAPALFAMDTWKVTRRLTVDLGIRWDPWISYRDISANNATVMFDPSWYYKGIHSTRYPNMPAGMLMGDDPGIPGTGIPSHYPVLDPRIGFAYDLFGNGKTSIRGGFGIYHDEPYANAFASGVGGPPTAEGVSFYFPKSVVNPYAGQFDPFPA